MERLSGELAYRARVGRLVCSFISGYETYVFHDSVGAEFAVIFKQEDLEAAPFDEDGKLDMEELNELLSKGIFPSSN